MPFRRDRLKGIREAKGLTLKDLADGCGLHLSRIGRYEAGPDEPNSRSLEALAAALDVSADYLLGREGEGVPFIRAAILQSLERFLRDASLPETDARRFRRIADHPGAPRSSAGWKALKEMLDLGLGPRRIPAKPVKLRRHALTGRKRGAKIDI